MALRGVKVLEIAGLAPAPFCGMVLADFGASVVRVDRTGFSPDADVLSNGKRSIAINLKSPKGVDLLKKLCKTSDVLIEPFRKGVMERLGLGPSVLMEKNPQLIYARLTGFGQTGCYSEKAGHDINYVAMSGVLSILGGKAERLTPPVNLAADFGGGGLMCALGIVLALYARNSLHRGQVVDCDMVGGCAYLASWLLRSQNIPLLWGQPRGCNILDGGAHFYNTYETKDGRWLAVGALEPQFYEDLLQGLGLPDIPQYPDNFEESMRIFTEKFKEKSLEEWIKIFEPLDACVTPVLSLAEAADHPHNKACGSFLPSTEEVVPSPAPHLSVTPGVGASSRPRPQIGQHTRLVLREVGISNGDIEALLREGVVKCGDNKL
ncbi:alpha-methylacyl-CoA racemase [Macrosteles quadrilineatus]|uniref:alpha-methylacyl-CoA racemase n=1 Tax=Macrosteles quadrilineatus TaxID=74068 RepID=UPI0023E0D4C3|nr:alpha-methylacyl-CoA racemase [Macrosteles quadrilineatus]XP_054281752.1 alpha-methylacyl-CoA racemase [Macrosteles quadrilineatus]XP_054281753.1 alpha-methylacyl-CoA racemase [Macrosteles quadrilineatus]